MTASPTQVNGTKTERRLPVMGDWRPVDSETTSEQPEPSQTETSLTTDPVAEAEAAAIRARSYAETEAAQKRADAEAEAIRIKAEGEAEKQRLANERQRMQNEQRRADHEKKLAETRAATEEIERQAEGARRKVEAEQEAEEKAAEDVEAADDKWRSYALNFYRVCAVVALPVQINAFYDPHALWLMAAPLMLEGGAWVVLKGAAAAVANHRPHWHYRLIAWMLAFIAAGINLWHGLAAFDLATAIGTAFASIAGPGVWDLHEHGRIRKRDGKLTRRERRAAKKEAKRLAVEQVAKELRESERQAYREKAAREAAEALDATRREEFPEVHRHARKLAADLGQTTITEAIWKQAKLDVEGAPPGESADVIRMRNAATARVEAARQKKPVSSLNKSKNAQRELQMPGRGRHLRGAGPAASGRRRQGDTPKYVSAARKQASIAAKNAAREEQS
ncbi:hypothetical protein [Streptomyces sp. WAC05858]|uniref:hypothetical protein n=1 Tax=Streptomyces TaxID=1883 RepID=UPI000F783AFF|nr:hypothetical protein [Streptomyces sp. WAC05858]RSS34690.1 hypothetical protein EF902_40040 [Streptomyces sp. WAC05858]